jgi:energy-coupling factor transporter transmembrane protein EcfT
MKFVKKILDTPYLVMLITFIIALISPSKIFPYTLGFICVFFFISLIYIAIQKKWLRTIFSLIGYFFVFVFIILVMIFKELLFSDELYKPEIQIGDSKFYTNEILNSSNLKMPKELKIISKLDTIVFMGFENEYNAECIYYGPKKIISQLENNIILNKDFRKVNKLESYPTKVLNEDKFNINELKSVFKKESEGRYIINIAFNKSCTKLYYSAYYY